MKGIYKTIFILCIFFIHCMPADACTIFCAQDEHGHMWAGNNEDFFYFDFSTRLKVVSPTDSTLGFIYFDYSNSFPQGGVNEAGLFFDANAIETSELKDFDKKPPFPGGTQALVFHMLKHFRTVPEVIDFFDRYKIPALRNAQVHLADAQGNKGIITGEKSWLTNSSFQVSTNFNLSHDDDDYKRSWRYPIANSMLANSNPSRELFTNICDSTSQSKGASTIYSNVHNLTTGDIWLYYGRDYSRPYKTSLNELTSLGDTTILLRDLFPDHTIVKAYHTSISDGFERGINLLNTIKDEKEREESIKMLLMDALFDTEKYFETRKITLVQDEGLINKIVEVCNNREVLTALNAQPISETTRELVRQKMHSVQPKKSNGIAIGLIALSGAVLLIFFFRKNAFATTS